MSLTEVAPGTGGNGIPSVDIVAVHGLNPRGRKNHAISTWTKISSPGDSRLWLRDDLPRDLPYARVFLYEYDSIPVLTQNHTSLVRQASNLLFCLDMERENCSERPLIFIAHSLGGILVKQALVNANNNPEYIRIRQSTCGLAFFATPHSGGNETLVSFGKKCADIVNFVTKSAKTDLLDAVKAGSLYCDVLSEGWRHQLNNYRILSFYEGIGNVVPFSSAVLNLPGGIETQVEIQANHSDICRFDTRNRSDAQQYRKVVYGLRKLHQVPLDSRPEASVTIPGADACHNDAATAALDPEHQATLYRSSVAVSEEDIPLPTLPEVLALVRSANHQSSHKPSTSEISDRNWVLPTFIKSFMHYDYKEAFDVISQSRHPSTCRWIFETDEMMWWDQNKDSQILWLTGHPGVGKSTLASYVADSFETRVTSRDTARSTVIFSFCDRQKNYTPSMLLSVVIHQILLKFDNLREFAYQQDMYQISGVSYNRVIKGKNKSASLLWNLLGLLIHKSGLEKVFLIIDALDVLDEEAQERLIGMFDNTLEASRRSKTQLKIFITSRPSDKITSLQSRRHKRYPLTLKCIEITKYEDKVNEDIDRFVQYHKASVIGAIYSPNQIKQIEDELAMSGPKTFLPITLWFEQLQRSSPEEPLRTLQSVSRDLTRFYTDLVSQLSPRLLTTRSPLMTFVTHAYTPLTLKELAFACCWAEKGLDKDGIFPVDAKNPLKEEDIDRAKARAKRYDPMLKFERDDSVSFFHDSIRDFLLQSSVKETSFFVGSSEKAHQDLALLTMKTILYKSRLPVSEVYIDGHGKTRINPSEHVFLSYAMQFWLQHLREAVPANTSFSNIQPDILQAVKDIVQIWEDKPSTRSFREIMLAQLGFDTGYGDLLRDLTPLEVLSALGLDPFLRAYLGALEVTQSLNRVARSIDKAVKLAIRGGHGGCFAILRKTFNISSLEGKEYKDIIAASTWSGQSNLVETVLRLRRSRINELIDALVAAFVRGDRESLDHLARDQSVFQDRNHFGMTALHGVFAYDNKTTVNSLGGYESRTASDIRVHLAICSFLIDNGIDVSARDNWGFTALHWACRSKKFCRKEIIEFLLERGADPHAQSITGLTSLHLAAYSSFNTSALQCLLDWSTNNRLLGIASRGRMTPLHWAVSRSSARRNAEDEEDEIIEFLLRRGADIRSPNLRGITPLEWAGQYRAETIQRIYSKLQGINIIDISHDGRPDLLIIWDDWTNIRLEAYTPGLENELVQSPPEPPTVDSGDLVQVGPESLLEPEDDFPLRLDLEDAQQQNGIQPRQRGGQSVRVLVARFNNRVRTFYRLRVVRRGP